MHRQYSGSISSFHAKTVGVPASAMAAAAWSCVLKMLQEQQAGLGVEDRQSLDEDAHLGRHVES